MRRIGQPGGKRLGSVQRHAVGREPRCHGGGSSKARLSAVSRNQFSLRKPLHRGRRPPHPKVRRRPSWNGDKKHSRDSRKIQRLAEKHLSRSLVYLGSAALYSHGKHTKENRPPVPARYMVAFPARAACRKRKIVPSHKAVMRDRLPSTGKLPFRPWQHAPHRWKNKNAPNLPLSGFHWVRFSVVVSA